MITDLAVLRPGSMNQFLPLWRPILAGTLRYLIAHPIGGWPVIWHRLLFAVAKRGLSREIRTPQGFTLKTSGELIVYAQIFIEQTLRYGPLLRDLKDRPNPWIVDVGYNCGFVAKWLNQYNQTANFLGIEVMFQHLVRDAEMRGQMLSPINAVTLNRAGWHKSGSPVQINIGDRVSAAGVKDPRQSFTVESIALDDIDHLQGTPIFMVKIDTDGSNVRVLDGARHVLNRTRWLLIELEDGVEEWIAHNLPNWQVTRLVADLVCRNSYDH